MVNLTCRTGTCASAIVPRVTHHAASERTKIAAVLVRIIWMLAQESLTQFMYSNLPAVLHPTAASTIRVHNATFVPIQSVTQLAAEETRTHQNRSVAATMFLVKVKDSW